MQGFTDRAIKREDYHLLLPPALSEETWVSFVRREPATPSTPEQLDELFRKVLPGPGPGPGPMPSLSSRQSIKPPREDCGTGQWRLLLNGLRNPSLTQSQISEFLEAINGSKPVLDLHKKTDHFVLWWTTSSQVTDHNISEDIVIETARHLEAAWTVFHETFGRTPLPSPIERQEKEPPAPIEVRFESSFGEWRGRTYPKGPIELDSFYFTRQPNIRRPTSAHELFHRLQYAFGFDNGWTEYVPPIDWFSEGLASWAEIHAWRRVSLASKLTALFSRPNQPFFESGYGAASFWTFLDRHRFDVGAETPIVHFLRAALDMKGDLVSALTRALERSSTNIGSLQKAFAEFTRDRWGNGWAGHEEAAINFPLLGPDNKRIRPRLKPPPTTLTPSSQWAVALPVAAWGGSYYQLRFTPECKEHILTLRITGRDCSIHLGGLRGRRRNSLFERSGTFADRFEEVIDLVRFSAVDISICGHEDGGEYALSAEVSRAPHVTVTAIEGD